MACGPYVDQARPARGGSGAPRRGPWLARRPPPAAPDKRAPPGNRLVRGSPGGVWARDIPLCRRAVPAGMVVPQHAACSNHADDGVCLDDQAQMRPISRGVPKLVRGRWEVGLEPAGTRSNRPRSSGWDGRRPAMLSTCRDHSCPAGTAGSDAVRTQHGPAARRHREFGKHARSCTDSVRRAATASA